MLNDYQYAQINNGGSEYLGTGSNKGSFTTARTQAATVAYNGYIYLTGGCTSLTAVPMNGCVASTSDTRYASIAADGTLTWSALNSNPTTNRYGHAAVAYNGYLYVLGGCSSTGGTNGFCNTFLRDVQRVKLNSDGNTTGNSWASAGNIFGTGRSGMSAAVYNGYIYVLGGCSAATSGNCTTFERTIEYAQINSDGSVSAWATTGGSGFTTGRYQQSAAAFGGKMYVMAGCSAMTSANCTTFHDDVQYATINSDGTVSSTWNSTVKIPVARYGASVTARNGMLYIIGGCSANSGGDCTAFQTDMQAAPIFADGYIGNWSGRVNAYTDPRFGHSTVASNGYMFVLGGVKSGSTLLADAQGGASQLQARVGRFSKLVDLGYESARINNILFNGALSDSFASISYKTSTTNAPTFTSSLTAPTIPEYACTGASAVKARYVLVTITLDDMSGAISGAGAYGETSTANLTDFTIRYNFIRPDPNIRLRLGQTLQQGELSAFDTCQG
jgi:N-acetylneuraminic acid mutarotase